MQQKSIRIFVRETLDADAKLIGAGGFHLTPSKRYLAQAQNMEKYLTGNRRAPTLSFPDSFIHDTQRTRLLQRLCR